MRLEAFSPHDRAPIIADVARTGRWDGTRAGCPCYIRRDADASGPRILYAVHIRSAIVSARAASVFSAIEEINQVVLMHRARRAPVVPINAPSEVLF